VKLAVLYTTGELPDWPDALDPYTSMFTYNGDNRSPGRALGGHAQSGEPPAEQGVRLGAPRPGITCPGSAIPATISRLSARARRAHLPPRTLARRYVEEGLRIPDEGDAVQRGSCRPVAAAADAVPAGRA